MTSLNRVALILLPSLILSGALLFFPFLIVNGATGVPEILNYQGRLLDSNGDLLGGSGTNYCFKFSLYDDATVGSPDSKLWPSGSPLTMTISVKSGVFNAAVGDTSAGGDALDFNFQDNDAVYMNVEVATKVGSTCAAGDGAESFENLAPRQRVFSSGYSINANTVGGFTPSQSPTGNQIPVLNSNNLLFGGAVIIDTTSTNALSIGTNANAKTITIGNNTGATSLVLTKGSSGNITLSGFNCSANANGGTLTTDSSGNITCADDDGGAGGGISSFNGSTSSTQTFVTSSETNLGLTIGTLNGVHTFTPTWIGTLGDSRISSASTWNAKITTSSLSSTATGLTYNNVSGVFSLTSGYEIPATASTSVWNAKENTLTFNSPLSRSVNTVSFNGAYATSGASGLQIASSSGTWTFSQATSTASVSGFLSSADWTTFNAKITTSSLSVAYAPLSYNNTTGVFSLPTSTASQSGFLSSGDWTTFNAKESALTFTSPLSRSVNVISMPTSTASQDGFLKAIDWTTFNAKQSLITLSTSSAYSNNIFTISSSSNTWTFNIPKDMEDIASIATTTGSLMVASSTGWKGLTPGTNGKVLMASSTASTGLSWETVAGVNLTTSASSTNTSSNSGLELVASDLAMLRGCSNGQLLKWSASTELWQCSADDSAGSPTLNTIAAAIADSAVQDSNANTLNWNWDFTTAAVDSGLNISESSASTNGTQDQQALVKISTKLNSTVSPLQIISSSTDAGDIFFDLSSAGDFEIRDAGTAFVTFNDTGTTTFAGQLVLSSASNVGISGGGLVDCDIAATSKLLWDSTTNKFSCGTDGSGSTIIEKDADETIQSDQTLSNDNTLVFTAVASTAYYVQVRAAWTSDSTADFQYTMTIPSGTIRASGRTFDSLALTGAIGEICNLNASGDVCSIVGTVVNDGILEINAIIAVGVTGGTVAFQWAQAVSTATNTTVFKNSFLEYTALAGASDLAEIYYTNQSGIFSSDVVSIDPSLASGVKKSEKSYDRNILGIVSTRPALLIGGTGEMGTPVPVALSGRVPVKVSTENGLIKPGDLLTSSNIPGVAMKATKAGPTIGQALTGFDGEGIGSVMVFVKNNYSHGDITSILPEGLIGTATSTPSFDLGKEILSRLITQKDIISTSTAIVSEIFTDRISAALEIISPRILTQGLEVETIGALDKEISLKGDIIFFGRPYFTADTAGFAVIKSGDKKVDVVFDKEYLEQPVVNAGISLEENENINEDAILNSGIAHIVNNKNVKGFSIVLNKPAPQDIKFSWMALAVKNAKTFFSLQTVEPVAPVVPQTSSIIESPIVVETTEQAIGEQPTEQTVQPEAEPIISDSTVPPEDSTIAPESGL